MAMAVSLITHMVDGEWNEMNENMKLQEVNDEDEEECVEAPVDDVEDDVPMANEWV